ncbi:unnamed protein product [Rhizophagus irregularis]|nr:unnamed protein product [Rhizophagus irregularis]
MYLLILEYAEGGTLRDHLRNNIVKWNSQLRFAREIISAIIWLHDYKSIVHGDLLNEKSDIYYLGVLFWKLASSSLLIDSPEDNYITLGAAVPNTNDKFTVLYQKCLKQEPDERPNISEVNETLSSIDNDESTVSDSEESEYSYQIDLNKNCQKL